ncbi:MAG: putative metal-dependent hydrolase [Bacteroidia bacterium]|nr:putative metal-dependent hydrolase [Bacteroidia bacterium]
MQEIIDLDQLRFPIGKFTLPENYSDENFSKWMTSMETLPDRLRAAVKNLDDAQLDTPYRPGGWTLRQVVHHLVDSHINSYCRFKLSLTEEVPVIRPYFEERWAELGDAKSGPIEMSLKLLDALHARLVYFMKEMKAPDWERKFFHPETNKEYQLKTILAIYAWHSEHHLNHILQLKKRSGWD